ncbi:MAG: aminotransferase class I/II-fold pyridoxal phosphate-dependent enzyme [Clostridiaceae bacterium]|nr:aminotransferase class I/II-fold pyridoxal phosphate-dependent enzyme [Clostridiaceae bacterium]
MSDYHIETRCIQSGYHPGNGEPRVLPIYQSTTFKYDSAATLGQLFDLEISGDFYTRLGNPTLTAVEEKIAELEGGVGALLTAAGQSASFFSVLNICKAGDHVISSSSIYGGTYNLFNKTMREMGIDFTFVNPDDDLETLERAFKPNTRLVFAETLANPTLVVLDIGKFADLAHKHGVPLIIDNTFPTPINCRPFDFGADIIVHSTTKYMDGHACSMGGVIVDGGRFNWENGRYPELTEPDESYHGVIYNKQFGAGAYIAKARTHLMRDLGAVASPFNAFLLNLGLETLFLRVERHCRNAETVAKYLSTDPRISWINYPGLPDNPYHALAQKYMPNGTCGVISFGIRGGRESAARFMEALKLAAIVIHVADARTCVLHPASTTHRQLSDDELAAAGITPDLIRLSVGIENVDDILADIRQALDQI